MNFPMFSFALETLDSIHKFLNLMMISSEERSLLFWDTEAKLLLRYTGSVCLEAGEGS